MPELFAKGGQFYEQVMRIKGHQPKETIHVQFPEIPNKIFALNVHKEVLEVCLGERHVPVGPLTPDEEAMAMMASMTSSSESDSEGVATTRLGMGGVINKPQHVVKAFSGKGNTLAPDTRRHAPLESGGGLSGEQQVCRGDGEKGLMFTCVWAVDPGSPDVAKHSSEHAPQQGGGATG